MRRRRTGQPAEANALFQAAQAFIAAGDMESQMRVMRQALCAQRPLRHIAGPLPGAVWQRVNRTSCWRWCAATRPPTCATAQCKSPSPATGIHWHTLRCADRGRALPPVWAKAYTALAGQYFDDRAPAIDAAFQTALDTRTIGDRLKTPLKPDSVIVGSVWFYYGARYGEHLAAGKSSAAGEWLPASLEAAPGNPDAYVALGDWYAEAGQPVNAIAQFEIALQLDADRGDAHDRIANVLWSEGRRAEAIVRWKTALATFLRIQSRGVRVPEPFWRRAAETFTDIGKRRALGQLRGEIAHLLGDYYQRNNQYRLQELIAPLAAASIESGEGTAWLVELGRSMADPEMILSALMRTPGLSDAQQIALQRDQIAQVTKNTEAAFGDNREWRAAQVAGARLQLISMLLDAGDVQGASAEWRLMPPAPAIRPRWGENRTRDQIEIRLASRTGTLAALLERYRTQPESAPPLQILRNAALALRRQLDENGARSVLEFLYDREIASGHLDAANFLGLAEVKLQRGDIAAAIALLNRMTLVVEDGFETLPPAAELLGKYGKTAEAADFLRKRVRAVPWDAAAKVRLAGTLPSGDAVRERLLASAVTDSQAAYEFRAEAARMGAGRGLASLSGTELALLSLAVVSPDAAAKPYQLEARIDAAGKAADAGVKLRLWQEALAIAPENARVRLGTLRAALAAGRDNLALAIRSNTPQEPQLTDPERASIAEALAAAAERLDDLNSAQTYLGVAIQLRPPNQRDSLQRKFQALTAELQRRSKNAARQPVVKSVIEQDTVVRPRILRSAQ